MKIGIVVFYTLYIISIIFTLASFFPTSNISKYIIKNGRDKKIRSDDNLLFWGHIYKYSRDEYKSKLEEKYKIKYDNQEYINDLIDQIIINSNITNTKFKFFKISVILAVIAIVQFTIFFIVDILI
jgi:hypothetical protein